MIGCALGVTARLLLQLHQHHPPPHADPERRGTAARWKPFANQSIAHGMAALQR